MSLPGAIRSPLAWWIGLPILLIGWTAGIVYFSRSWSSPDRIIAGLEAQFAKVERDESRPGRPLVGVDLKSIPVDDVDWGGLSMLKDLRKLSSRAMPDSGLAHLAGLAGLRELHLNGGAITDEGLIHLEHLTDLESLDLQATKVSGRGLGSLAGLPRLRELTSSMTPVTGEGLPRRWARCPSFRLFASTTRSSMAEALLTWAR